MTGKRALGALVDSVIITAIVAVIATLVIAFIGDEASMSYRSLDYQVTVQPDGDLEIVQYVDVHLREREDANGRTLPWKQLYQQYRINPDNLTGISGVSVTDASTGESYQPISPRTPSGIGDDEWNATYAGHAYIADVTNGANDPQPFLLEPDDPSAERVMEIGWNIPVTKSADSMRFIITMTFEGVTTAYDDIATFQWEPFGPSNQVPIGTVTGTVRLPEGGDESLTRAWLHFSGTSETSRSNNVLQFTAYDVRAGQHLDLVAMVDVRATDGVVRTASGQGAQLIIDDENRQERQWRESQRAAAVRRVIVWVALAIIGVAAIIWGVVASIGSNRKANYRGDIEYWRDAPECSPASAAKLISIVDPDRAGSVKTRQMAGTVLSLASKHVISVRPGPAVLYDGVGSEADDRSAAAAATRRFTSSTEMNTTTITLSPVITQSFGRPSKDADAARTALHLTRPEDVVLSMFEGVYARRHFSTFDLNEMGRVYRNSKYGYELQQDFVKACDNEFALLGATRPVGGQAMAAGILGVVVAAIALLFGGFEGQLAVALLLGCPLLLGSVFVLRSLRRDGLTERGQQLAGQVVGLRRYLEDFSDFSDRGVADLALWDRYLVYAAAFGISDVAIKQLAAAYPELSDPQWLDSHAAGHVVYWSYRPYWYAHAWSEGTAAPAVDIASFSANVGDIGAQLHAGLSDIALTFSASAPHSSGGSFLGGGFGGSSGGSGGGSFGGR